MTALGNIIAGMFRPPILTAADLLKRVLNRPDTEPDIIAAPPEHATLGCNTCSWHTDLCAHCEQVDATNDLLAHYVAAHWEELGNLRALLDPPEPLYPYNGVPEPLYPYNGVCDIHGAWMSVDKNFCPFHFEDGAPFPEKVPEPSVSEPDSSPPES